MDTRRTFSASSESSELPESLNFLFTSAESDYAEVNRTRAHSAAQESASGSTSSTEKDGEYTPDKHRLPTIPLHILNADSATDDSLHTPPSTVIGDPQIKELFRAIRLLASHGKHLATKDDADSKTKGKDVFRLANTLHVKANDFFKQSSARVREGFTTFRDDFLTDLHSQDKIMRKIRKKHLWKPVVINIVAATSGVGAIAIAGKLIQSKVADHHASFFNCETKRQRIIKKIEKILKGAEYISQSLSSHL